MMKHLSHLCFFEFTTVILLHSKRVLVPVENVASRGCQHPPTPDCSVIDTTPHCVLTLSLIKLCTLWVH